jgi:hypothetical protein
MTEPCITYDKNGHATSFVGHEAISVWDAAVLMTGIKLLSKGIIPRRGWTMTKALAAASAYSGRKYKRTEWPQAIEDIRVWKETMLSTIPTEVQP